jgi:hypothetical protein
MRKKFFSRYAKEMLLGRTTYKSKVVGLEDNAFDVGNTSNPAKFSKLLKNFENYIQNTYRSPNDMVKMLQQMKKGGPQLPDQAKEPGPRML